MRKPRGSQEVDLETEKVVVRHDDRVIEVLEKPLSWDDLVLGSTLCVGLVLLACTLLYPVNAATLLLSPFTLLFIGLGGYGTLQRIFHPAVRIDRLTWRVDGAGPSSSFAGPPRAGARTTVYVADGVPGRHWAVELRRGDQRFNIVNGLGSEDDAEAIAERLNALIGAETPAT